MADYHQTTFPRKGLWSGPRPGWWLLLLTTWIYSQYIYTGYPGYSLYSCIMSWQYTEVLSHLTNFWRFSNAACVSPYTEKIQYLFYNIIHIYACIQHIKKIQKQRTCQFTYLTSHMLSLFNIKIWKRILPSLQQEAFRSLDMTSTGIKKENWMCP